MEKVGHLAVSEQHEFLYQLMRVQPLFLEHSDRVAVRIELEADFILFEVYGAFFHLIGPKLFRDCIEYSQHLSKMGIFLCSAGGKMPIDQFLRGFVGKSLLRVDDGLSEPAFIYAAVLVHLKDRGKCAAVDIGIERAEVVRKRVGKHGDGAVDEID